MTSRVGDFGLSRLIIAVQSFQMSQYHNSTIGIKGIVDYGAPSNCSFYPLLTNLLIVFLGMKWFRLRR